MTIKSSSSRLRPEAEKFAAPVRSTWPPTWWLLRCMRAELSCLTRISTLGVFGQSLESLRSLGFSQSTGIEINTHSDATVCRPYERLNDKPVSQNIGRKIDFMFCAVD